MFNVGITGGIGSGKTTLCEYLEEMYAIPVYYADLHAKRLMTENEKVVSDIRTIFGEKAYVDGQLNRKYISSVVFSDAELLSGLNNAVHHAVIEDYRLWAQTQTSPYVVCEAAIMIESGWYTEMDLVVAVTAPVEERVRRVMARDGVTPEKVMERISAQMDDDERKKYADVVVVTDDSDTTANMAAVLHERIMDYVENRR